MKNRKKVSEAETIHKSKGEKHSEARRPSPARQTEKTGDQVQAGARPPKGGTPNHFPIVGIGASAGGLEAFTELLKHLPVDTGLGFVLVQHLDPQHESALTQILARATSMPVREATNNLRVEANRVYIIPPNTNLTIQRGVLQLGPRQDGRRPARSIDSFFESLAQDQRERAIGVILSGTATDGTLGLEAIKAEGGITFAQDESAKYDSMPKNAVAAGCVDFVLKPKDIAKELARIAMHPYVAGQPSELVSPAEDRASATAHEDDETPLPSGGRGSQPTGAKRARGKGGENGFKNILLLLRNHSGADFSLYKSTTIRRRITRRMVLNRKNTLEDYADFLRGNGKELDALYSDVLISVTSFFRNPEAFDVLKSKVFPKLLQRRGDDPFRVWVLGCSTGQEAYSIAMTFVEAAEKAPRLSKLQVFATDLNNALLDKARHALYAKSLAQDVSPERLRRFFVEEEGGYRVVKQLREMVVFARQNLISDPPFSRMDLISCRNLLIYLEPSLQQKAFPTFHYALKPEGFLLLGASESIGGFTELFEPVDKKHKIFSRKSAPIRTFHLPTRKEHGQAKRGSVSRSALSGPDLLRLTEPRSAPEGFRGELNAQREADRVTVNQFAPPGVLVNADLQVLQFRGPTSAYLEPPTGKASFDVLKMAREGLMLPLRAAINKAKKENKTARRENVRINQNGNTRTVNVEVIPLKNLRERCFLILFEEGSAGVPPAVEASRRDTSDRRASKQSVGGTPTGATGTVALPAREKSSRVSELEREVSETRDYLQSIQEQHEAANEELQASNEEVTSANEELQSVNEELETSKEELESANEELTTVNEEMANRNVELIRLSSDLGNLQTSTRLAIVLLGRDLTIRRFSAQAEKQFNLLALDIGRPLSNLRHNLVFGKGSATVPVAVEASRRDTSQRRAATEPVGGTPTGATGTVALPGTDSPPDLETLVREVIDTVREQEHEVQDRDGRWFSLRVRPYMSLDNKVDGAVLVLVDINDLKRNEQEAKAARNYAEATIRTARDPLIVLRGDLRVNTANEAFYKAFQTTPDQTEGRLIYEVGNRQWDIPKLRALLEDILPRNSFFNDFEVTHNFPDIGRRTMLLNARRLDQLADTPQMILFSIEDITERQRLDEKVRVSEIRYRRLFEAAHEGVLILDSVSRKITDTNPFVADLLGYTREELLGKELWQIGLLKNEQTSHAAFRELQQTGFVRCEDLPLQTKSGDKRAVEVMANRYDEDGTSVIQCNIRDITERKQAGVLRESEERFRVLADSAPALIWVNGPEGAEFVNRGYAAFLGVDVPDVRGYDWARFIHLDDRDGYVNAYLRAMEQRAPFDAEFRFRRHDGEYRWMHSVGQPRIGPNGEFLGYSGITTDITERKEAEEALRESEERYRTLFDSMDEGYCIIEVIFDAHEKPVDYRFVEVNGAFEKQSGMHDVVGKRMLEFVPDIEGHWLTNYGSVARTGVPVRFAGAYKGLHRSFEVYAFRVGESGSNWVAVLFTDITERKQYDETRARLAAIVESSEDAIVSKDLNGIITSWNQGAERLFGYTAREAVGQSVTMLIPADHLDEEPGLLERIRQGESIANYETVRRRKDGTLLDISLTLSPIRNSDGQVVGASKVARDISHRKRNEAMLRQAQAQLADRAGQLEAAVAERTAEVTATNKQLEAFVYSIAHDLRAPLRSMQGFSAILVEEEAAGLSERGQDCAHRINRSAQFMDALLQDLLAFSRISQQPIDLTSVSFETVMQSVLSRLENEIKEKNARAENVGPWPCVLAYEPTLGQVLFNLISNSLKFVSPEVPPLIRLRAEDQGEFVRVWVEDNGIGIAPDHQEQIFRLFIRLHGQKYPGTGIGLAIVQKGVERMGGRVGVESTPRQGSRFWFELRKANPTEG